MSSLTVSVLVFACIFGGAVLGMFLGSVLSDKHLSAETKDLVKLSMGLIGTMTALVLGLLTASAKSSFDMQKNGVAQLAGNVIMLDRTLAHYGPESQDVRAVLRASLADLLQRTWPDESPGAGGAADKSPTEGRYEGIYEMIQQLAPKNDAQRTAQAQALKAAADTAQLRWSLFAQKGSSIPVPLLVVMVAWLTLILASFGLLAPRNALVLTTLLICAAVVSSAIFLILELDRPFEGAIRISSTPIRNALAQLGR